MRISEAPRHRLVVLDLDMLDLPERLDEADSFDGALVLLRLNGRPVGQAILAFSRWSHERPIFEQLAAAANSAFWEHWLDYRLSGLAVAEQKPDLSNVDVIICTRDRPADLRKCLTELAAMPQDGQRYLVVDNASSTEETRQVVEAFPDVIYIREDRPGLDIARNTGIRATDREVLAFIDDDASPDPLWLRKLCRNFDNPLVMAAGGLTMAMELVDEAQIAFERLGGFGRGFKPVIYHQGNCFPFHAWCAGAGVNMALRRKIVDEIGWFDEALDAGTKSLAGGDADYFRRIISAGWRIAYEPEALNWHRHRRTMAELQHQLYGYEVSAFAIITKALLYERDAQALVAILRWLRSRLRQAPKLFRSPAPLPFRVELTQVKGAMDGPGRYRQAMKVLHAAR